MDRVITPAESFIHKTSNRYCTCKRKIKRPDPEDVETFGIEDPRDKGFQKLLSVKWNCPHLIAADNEITDFLYFTKNKIAAYRKFGGFIGNNTHLKALIMDSLGITTNEMVALSEGLQHNCSIAYFLIRDNQYGTIGLQSLVPFAVNNPSFEEIVLDYHQGEDSFGDESVNIICQIMRDRYSRGNSSLKSLQLTGNDITSLGIEALAGAVTHIGSDAKGMRVHLSTSSLGGNEFAAIASLLSHPRCYLHRIDISHNYICDSALILFAEHLKHNSMLKSLDVTVDEIEFTDGLDEIISPVGLKALLNLVCDSSSIKATYESNHTITCFGSFSDDVHGNPEAQAVFEMLKKYLEMNKKGPSQTSIAREKILFRHFSGGFNLQPIYDIMKTTSSILPFLLGWLTVDASPTVCSRTGRRVKKRKRSVCAFVVTGDTCPLTHNVGHPDACPLFHDFEHYLSHEEALQNSTCPLFALNQCALGGSCPFPHVPLKGQELVYDQTKLSAVFRILMSVPNAICGLEREEEQKLL